jgi:hypothetical protein
MAAGHCTNYMMPFHTVNYQDVYNEVAYVLLFKATVIRNFLKFSAEKHYHASLHLNTINVCTL